MSCNYKAVKGRNDEWIMRVMYTYRGQREESRGERENIAADEKAVS